MKKLLLLSSALMLIAFSGWAQKTVAGTVLDDGGLHYLVQLLLKKEQPMVYRQISMETSRLK